MSKGDRQGNIQKDKLERISLAWVQLKLFQCNTWRQQFGKAEHFVSQGAWEKLQIETRFIFYLWDVQFAVDGDHCSHVFVCVYKYMYMCLILSLWQLKLQVNTST